MLNPFATGGEEQGERGEALPEKHDGLPNSDVKAGLCPRCMKQSSFEVVETIPVSFDGGQLVSRDGTGRPTHTDQASVLQCRHCRQCTVVIEEKYLEAYSEEGPSGISTGGKRIRWRGIHWWPLPTPELSDDVPTEIVDAFAEAERSLAAGCPRAAAVMARRTLEAITSHIGKSNGSLYKQLEELKDEGDIHPTLHEWATEIRLIGNVGAHFDPIDTVSEHEAEQLILFIRELLKYVFEFPSRLDGLRNS